jgi:hypothetical protein
MAKQGLSSRHLQIDKANSTMFLLIAVASVSLVFSLMAAQSLWKQASYNRKVIQAKEATLQQVESNIQALGPLEDSYEAFVQQPENIIGGSSTGTGDRDGDNAKITLDALPSVYDFPGTISGFNKVFNSGVYGTVEMTGTDDELNQQTNVVPEIVDIPINFTATGDVQKMQELISLMDRSIRPISIQQLTFSGDSSGALELTIAGTTYYQPKKNFEVKTEVVQ